MNEGKRTPTQRADSVSSRSASQFLPQNHPHQTPTPLPSSGFFDSTILGGRNLGTLVSASHSRDGLDPERPRTVPSVTAALLPELRYAEP